MGGPSVALTSTMYYTDENGQAQPYHTIDSAENRVWVEYADLEKTYLPEALVAIEDKRFYDHKGVDWLRTGRGVLNMFTGGSIEGGSTLTQQFIKNNTGENQVTVKRKITEIFRALALEKRYKKDEILELYLNQIYLGERCYGVGAASWAYFGKDVRELSLAQCASLVGITNNPSRYDPYLNRNAEYTNDAANRKRAKLVLELMREQGKIDQATYEAACGEVDVMEFVSGSPEGVKTTAVTNWYQDQVIKDVSADLMEKYDWSERTAIDKIYRGGLSIYTNIDPRVQDIVDQVYGDRENLKYKSKSGQDLQSAMVIVDDQGRVVALSGGVGEKKENRSWSRASDSKRPAGSSIKPLSVYAPALNMGLITPYSVIDDAPYQFVGGSAWPSNSFHYYKGLDTVSHALAVSTNTIAVRVLGDYVTLQESFDFMEKRFHISSLVLDKTINGKRFSDMDLAPLALGGLTNGVSVYEMAAAYATFPSMGRYVPPRTYSKVLDANGNVLLDRTTDGEVAIKESTAYYINNLLKGVVQGGGTGASAAFSGMTIAGKTGTTTSRKDVWFIGYTPYYTAAVWVGYDRQERLGDIGTPQITLWKKVMSKVHEGLPNKSFPQPSGIATVSASYCLDSGLAPTEACSQDVRGSRVATGTFLSGDQPSRSCDRHTTIQVCTASPFVDEETGEPKEYFHIAGEFCPEESVKTVSVLDYAREGAAATASTQDSWVLKSQYEAAGVCTVHNEDFQGTVFFDPEDPATWPTDDPNFNIEDETTWPGHRPDETDPPQPSGQPGGEETGHPPAASQPPESHAPATPPPAHAPGDEP